MGKQKHPSVWVVDINDQAFTYSSQGEAYKAVAEWAVTQPDCEQWILNHDSHSPVLELSVSEMVKILYDNGYEYSNLDIGIQETRLGTAICL